ncbi:gastrula zinc finger protein XlCGF621-like [Vespula maculifrons]|uniref:Gastrula zinc finger protein XlCGF621-like n=1 Tax=Vespula maculifrons TaxID=7453 RepID=A0ABD2AP62_VESMC
MSSPLNIVRVSDPLSVDIKSAHLSSLKLEYDECNETRSLKRTDNEDNTQKETSVLFVDRFKAETTTLDIKGSSKKKINKNVECDHCQRRFLKKSNLIEHLKQHRHKCTDCSKTFSLRRYLISHIERIHRRQIYECSVCEYKSNRGRSHEKRLYETNEKACEFCEQKFHFVTRLVAHLRIVHGIHRPFKCMICGKNYPQQFMLNAHVKKCHTPKTVPCTQCTFMGVDTSDVERHKKRHHREDKFTCEICSEIFTEKVALTAHTTMHNFMEYHQCNACGGTFNDVYRYQIYFFDKKYLTQQVPIVIVYCYRSSSLKEHNRLYHYDPSNATLFIIKIR